VESGDPAYGYVYKRGKISAEDGIYLVAQFIPSRTYFRFAMAR